MVEISLDPFTPPLLELYFHFTYALTSLQIDKNNEHTHTHIFFELEEKRGQDREYMVTEFSDVIRFLSLLAFLHIIASSYKHIFLVVVMCVCV